jgi:hypothetical protein
MMNTALLPTALRPVPGLPRGTSTKIAKWLCEGSVGMSSMAILSHCTTGLFQKTNHHPYDPSDLRRCMKLLDAIPALKKRFHRMLKVSPEWSTLWIHWADLTVTLTREMTERTDERAPERRTPR